MSLQHQWHAWNQKGNKTDKATWQIHENRQVELVKTVVGTVNMFTIWLHEGVYKLKEFVVCK